MSEAMIVLLDEEMNAQLERLAQVTSRAKAKLVIDAITQYLSINDWQAEAIKEGIRQASAGELAPHEDIREKWEAKLAHTYD